MRKINITLLLGLILIVALVNVGTETENKNQKNIDKVILWNHTLNNSDKCNYPLNYQKYVMPNNPIVQEYAKQLNVKLGWNNFEYKNGSGLALYPTQNKSLLKETDEKDYWQNPDYTLTVGYGDCEDLALVACSILKAKDIPSIVVLGYAYPNEKERRGHAWTEYYIDGEYFVNNNLNSFPRNIQEDNSIYYYYTPNMIFSFVNNTSENITIQGMKLQPRHIFNDNLKRRPYHKNWIILV